MMQTQGILFSFSFSVTSMGDNNTASVLCLESQLSAFMERTAGKGPRPTQHMMSCVLRGGGRDLIEGAQTPYSLPRVNMA